MSDHEILDELHLARGFTLIAWAFENNGVTPVKVCGRAYIGQEVDRLLKHRE
jgi:hypothetical protein